GLKPFVQREETARCAKALSEARAGLAKAPGKLAAARLAAAEAQEASVKARITADEAKYHRIGNAEHLARAAARAEPAANLCAATEKLLQTEQAVEAARPKAGVPLKQAEQQALTARKAVELARQATTKDDAVYTPFSPVYPQKSTGRRTALAHWIAD